MSRQKIIIAVVIVVAVGVAAWFLTPNREEKAQAQLEAIYQVEQAGKFDQALARYESLVEEYGGTQAAALAADYIERVIRYKERRQIDEVRRNLGRIALVMNGYREMLGTTPTSLDQLDNSDYMFDSDYIAEIPPEGYTYALRFEPAASTYTIFSVKDGAETAIVYDAQGKARVISLADYEKALEQEGLMKTVKGRMVFLQPSS